MPKPGLKAGRAAANALAFALLCGAPQVCAFEVVFGPDATASDDPAAIALREFGPHDGLTDSRIYTLAQDRDGFVWAGTEAGVARYDGRRWESVALPLSEHDAVPYINKLVAAGDGAMWIATDELGVLRYHNGQFARFAFPGADTATLQALAPDGANAVWIGGSAGVGHCTPAGCTAVPGTQDLNVFVLCPAVADDGRPVLWVGSINAGLNRLDDLSGTTPHLGDVHLSSADGLPATSVRALAVWGGSEGRDLWIGTATGVSRLAHDRLTVYNERNGLRTTAVVALAPSRDTHGRAVLYAGLARGGLAEFQENGNWRRIGTDGGLVDDNVYSLLVTDSELRTPRLWLGTKSSGVLRRDAGLWATIDTARGLPNRVISGLGQARFPDGAVGYWVGTASGAVRREGEHWIAFGPAPLDHAAINAVATTADGSMWIAADLGLFRYDRAGVKLIEHPAIGLPGDGVIDVYVWRANDGVEEVWFGTRHGAGRVRAGHVLALPEGGPDWLRSGLVRVFALTPSDAAAPWLWVGGEPGLVRYDGARWELLPDDCLPHREVFDLRLNPHAASPELWAATRRGVTRIRWLPSLVCRSLSAPTLPSPISYQVQFDAVGRAYVFGYQGVARINADAAAADLEGHSSLDTYDLSDGLPALEFNRASFVDRGGRVWGGTISGVAVFDPTDEPQPQAPKPLKLEAVRLGASASEHLLPNSELAYGSSDLRFDFTLLSFEREQRTRYRSELVGLDSAPSAWGTESNVTYRRLPAGEYRFLVWARDALGTISGPLEFGFRVAQPYWQRPWAIGGYALLLLLIGAAIGRARARALARRADALEREVADRTQALATANLRLSEASVTDPLTGLHNRRYFSDTVAATLHAAVTRPGRNLHLVCLVDLDHFKAINDNEGHAGGDRLLREIAGNLRQALGADGAIVRWGGEEFLIVTALADAVQAPAMVQKLLACVRASRVMLVHGERGVTASFGWILWPWDVHAPERVTLDQALTLADQALYRAKQAGRDRAFAALHRGGVSEPGANLQTEVIWEDSRTVV